MARVYRPWAGVLLLLVLGWAGLVAGWNHVLPEAFHEKIAGDDAVLVAFVAPEESKSSALESEWTTAVADAKDTLISINCSDPESVCDSEGIDSLPLIALFRNGNVIARYQGPYRAGALLHFVTRQKRPAISWALSAEDLAKFKTVDETVFVAYVNPEDPAPAEVYSDVARQYRDEFTFGVVDDPAVAEAQGIKVPAVVCYKPIDGDTVQLDELDDPGKVDEWVKEASRPVIGELTALNRQRLLERGWPMVYVFAATENERQQIRKTLYKFARSYYDSLTSVLVDPHQFPDLMETLGLDPNVLPNGVVHQLSKDRIYHWPKDKQLNPSNLQQWGLDIYQGRIKPWTSPGVTTTYDDLGPAKVGTRPVSLRSAPGVAIKVAGHDEL